MGMSEFYGVGDDAESIATIHEALDSGVNFLDTADMYGPFKNEELVGRAIAGRRDEVVLATKFGNQRGDDGSFVRINGTPEYVLRGVRRVAPASRRRRDRPLLPAPRRSHGADRGDLGGDEVAWSRRARCATSGISEASSATIERAHAVHPVSALQSEYSLWTS